MNEIFIIFKPDCYQHRWWFKNMLIVILSYLFSVASKGISCSDQQYKSAKITFLVPVASSRSLPLILRCWISSLCNVQLKQLYRWEKYWTSVPYHTQLWSHPSWFADVGCCPAWILQFNYFSFRVCVCVFVCVLDDSLLHRLVYYPMILQWLSSNARKIVMLISFVLLFFKRPA